MPVGTEEAPRADHGETVLIVDDEPTLRMLVTDVLQHLGYTAIEAGDSMADTTQMYASISSSPTLGCRVA